MKTVSAGGLLPKMQQSTLIDVRTEEEFQRGHIPHAISHPLLSHYERAEIGWLYKNLGKNQALNKGWAVVMPKLNDFIQSFEKWHDHPLLIYCARGGMRSASVCQVLAQIGFNVSQLSGGYKTFRSWLLQRVEQLQELASTKILVLQGLTGVGKTQLLRKLNNHLDLEACAQHRGSLFGGVGLKPHTQQQFEANLWLAMEKLDFKRPLWVEAESSKIGSALLPRPLHKAIRSSPQIWIVAPLHSRIKRIISEYGSFISDERQQLENAITSLKDLLGKQQTKQLLLWLKQDKLEDIVHLLISNYYDPRYLRSIGKRQWAVVVSSEHLQPAVQKLSEFAQNYPIPN